VNYLPLLAFVVVLAILIAIAARARRRQAAAQAELVQRIGVGTDVMTTSGLYGTVVATNDDGTVQLSIAPGLEVKWELLALRDRAALPPRLTARTNGSPLADGRPNLEKDDSGHPGDPR
jgi:preprotein translocase subunit YajC